MKLRNTLLTLVAAICMANAAHAQVPIPLVNPSFESPALTSSAGWYGGVDGWGSLPAGAIGTTYAQPWMASSPAPDGTQYCWADQDDAHVFQQVGLIEANTWYTFRVDVFPIQASANSRVEVVMEETDTWSAILAGAYYHPGWNPTQEDFALPDGVWTTVEIAFNSADFPNLVGNNMRVRVSGYHLAIDNAALTKDANRTYYISSSGGDDNADGLSEATAWQTFAPVNSRTLYPGETVALNRGDVWTEELHLWGKGVAGAPIELTAYGSGALPQIDRDDLDYGYCVVVEGASFWRINNIAGVDAKLGLYLRYEDDYGNEDVIVEDCYFENMSSGLYEPVNYNYEVAWSSGIFVGGKVGAGNDHLNVLDNLTVRNCQMINCVVGFGTNWFFPLKNYSRLTNVYIEDCVATKTLSGGVWLNYITGGHCKRLSVYDRADVTGLSFGTGTTGGFMQYCQDFTIDQCEFSDTARIPGEADGTGFDFEGDSHNITFTNNVIHNNDGAGILLLSSQGINTNITIANCTLYNNSQNPLGNPGDNDYEFKSAAGQDSTGTITNVGIYRDSSSTSGWFSSKWDGFSISNTRQDYYSSVSNRGTYWEFDTDGNLEGWNTFNQWSNNTVSGGVLNGLSTGGDPYANSGNTFLNTHMFPFIRVNMALNAGANAQLFFVTETDAVWNPAKSIWFPIVSDGTMREYLIDMRDVPDYKGVVTAVRIDPTDTANATFSIDYVRPVMSDGVTTGPGGGSGSWTTLAYDDFEGGWGAYTDGGSDCRRSANDAAYAHQGTYCVRLRDNSGSASAMTMGSGLNVTSFSEVRIAFWFWPNSMESGEDFFLEVNNGSGWTVLGQYVRGTDFNNGAFYRIEEVVYVTAVPDPANMRVRLRCDASSNADQVYIDEVEVSAR